jgi:hypothetical protein
MVIKKNNSKRGKDDEYNRAFFRQQQRDMGTVS